MSADSEKKPKKRTARIKVAGVEFAAEHVVSATLKIDGREIHISKEDEPAKRMGFK